MTTDHTTDRRLMQVQAASGALFALFLLVHLGNTLSAIAGPAVYDGVQAPLRAVYQTPAIEIGLVIGPLLVHIGASVARMLRRRRLGQPAPRAARSRLQRHSAIVLLMFIAGHVLATRGASLVYDVFPGFHGVAFTTVWTPAAFIPYYTVFSAAALYHMVNGLTLALPRLGLRGPGWLRSTRAVYAVSIVGALGLVLAVASFAGAFDAVREQAVDSGYARILEQLGFVDRAALGGSP